MKKHTFISLCRKMTVTPFLLFLMPTCLYAGGWTSEYMIDSNSNLSHEDWVDTSPEGQCIAIPGTNKIYCIYQRLSYTDDINRVDIYYRKSGLIIRSAIIPNLPF